MRILFTILLAISLLTSCSNNSDTLLPNLQKETTSPISQTTGVPTKEPTEKPTKEPLPTIEAKVLDDVEPTKIFAYSGSGDDVVTGVSTEILSKFRFICKNTRHKSVKAHYGDDYDLLVNSTDSYDGYTLLLPDREYTFEVNASDKWEIEVYSFGTSSTDNFSGYGDDVTPLFLSSSNIYEITTEGKGHLAIRGYTDYGYDLLVNTTDPYSGKVMFNSKDEYGFFEITSERKWTIKPVK
jgi:hypothetical protein